ncbi:hypothetical protein JTB14_006040 [Gonioctena quinquepunctata]|nr:hypothetical protein JTB14_006040 [Gonioctena quinquepunctata]
MNLYENCQYSLIVIYETEYQNTKQEGEERRRKDSSEDQDDNDELENPSCSSETGKENELVKNKNYSNSNDNFCQRRSKHTTPLRYREEFCKLAMDKPISSEDAISGTEEEQWKKAIVEELESMEKNKEWDIVVVEKGIPKYLLSIQIFRQENYLALSQKQFIYKLLEKYNFLNCKPTSTPMDCGTRLEKVKPGDSRTDKELYRSKIASLLYLVMGTRPYRGYFVSVLCGSINHT